jgi:hypothetical protein
MRFNRWLPCFSLQKPPANTFYRTVFYVAFFLVGRPLIADDDITALLAGRIQHDRELKTRAIELRQAELSESQTKISNTISVTLNTGTLTFTFADGDDASSAGSFYAEPSVSVSLPALNDAAFTVKTPLHGGNGLTSSDTSFTLSVDVTGNARRKRLVELLQAERAVAEAKRTLQKRAVEAETEFYEALRNIYELESELYTKREKQWTEALEFAKVRAQGYDERSAVYRTARMELAKAEREASEAERLLARDIAVFARDCGREDGIRLPQAVPVLEDGSLLSLADFDASRYTELESAEWRQRINTLSREADGELGVRLEGGGTINNSTFQNQSGDGVHSVNTGVSLSWRGVSLSGGLEFPIGAQTGTPAFTLSVGVNSAEFSRAPLKKQQDILAAQKEVLEIENAGRSWDDILAETERTRSDLLWQRNERAEQFELYRELESDMRIWFEQGIISESEYRQAEANKENARYNCLITDTDIILYQIGIAHYVVGE